MFRQDLSPYDNQQVNLMFRHFSISLTIQ